MSDSLLLSLGPLIYLYILKKINLNGSTQISWIKTLHFIPLFYFLITDFTEGVESIFYKSYAVLFVTIFYASVSLVLIWKHKFDSSIQRVKIRIYKRQLIKLVAPFLMVPLLIVGLIKYSYPAFGFGAATIPYVLISVMFYRMTFIMMVKGKSYLNEISPTINMVRFDPTDFRENPKVVGLISFMENQRPYLDPELDLTKLALKYGTKRHELSVLINRDINIRFNDFVNYWRVETAKKYLLDASLDHLTIIGLGHKSGFKSKSTFFESFKKYTGMTPNTYIETSKS